jgi:hypothetical protein
MNSPRARALLVTSAMLCAAFALNAGDLTPSQAAKATSINCNNLVYANGQTSVCFADKFLTTAAQKAGLKIAPTFTAAKLDTEAIFNSPFTVISGEGTFRFSEKERENLRRYLLCGGFLLASPGCSDSEWDIAFRNQLKALIPEAQLTRLPMTHPVFSTMFKIPSLSLKRGGTTLVEGLEINGRLVMIYSTEGLNDAYNAKGCCCCGGNQIRESEQVNVNILCYALLH